MHNKKFYSLMVECNGVASCLENGSIICNEDLTKFFAFSLNGINNITIDGMQDLNEVVDGNTSTITGKLKGKQIKLYIIW